MANMSDQIISLAITMANECNQIRIERGPLADLATTDKTSIVRAINELKTRIDNGGGGGGAGIDDAVTGTTTTWSSSKISQYVTDLIAALPAAATIDDLTTSNASVWSSQKTAQAISQAIAALPPIPEISDGSISGSTVWSSSKTNSSIQALINNNATSTTNTWASTKIVEAIAESAADSSEINDGATAADSTWSSSKISSTITDSHNSITKASLGLGNVDNTSDANKPVSAAQAAADTATLNAAKTYTDQAVTGLYDDRGNYDASSNAFPTTGGSGAAGAVVKGDIWRISVGGTLGGAAVTVDQQVRALQDAPGQTAANWAITGGNFSITQTITNGATGTAPSSDAVFDALQGKQDLLSVGTALQYRRGDNSLSTFNADAIGSVLTGLSTASGSNVIATDSVLQAVGKLQAQATAGAAATAGITKTSLGLANVDNTSDVNKPVSTAQAAADTATLNAAKAYTDGKPAAATNTDGLPEGATNKYMTQSGVINMLLAGLSTASGAVIAATDSILVAMGKLQKQITDLAASAVTATGVATLTNKTLTDPLITGYREKIQQLTAGTAFSPDPTLGTYISCPTTGATTITMPAPAAQRQWTLEIVYGGIHDVTFTGGAIKWEKSTAPTPTKIGSRIDLYVFTANAAGTAWLGADGGRAYF